MRPTVRLAMTLIATGITATMPIATATAEPLNILWFGNSFSTSVYNPVRLMAAADGHDTPTIVTEITGGETLDYHLSQVDGPSGTSNVGALPSGQTYDYVVIQGFSTEATDRLGDYNTFASDAYNLFNAVTTHASGKGAGAKAMLYQTWAYHPNHSFYQPGSSGSPPIFASPTQMQAQIRTGYETAVSYIDLQLTPGTADIAPVGDAFESTGFADYLYRAPNLSDGDASNDYPGWDHHPSGMGNVLAGMILYRKLYNEDVSDIVYTDLNDFTWRVSESEFYTLASIADAVHLPEPTSLMLLSIGSLALVRYRRTTN